VHRSGLLLTLLVACGDGGTTPDANTHTSAITAQVCTSGNPGDPTCPITMVDLGNGDKLQFVLMPDAANFFVGSPKLIAGSAGLYVLHPRFEAWPDGAAAPTPNPSDPNATSTINIAAGAQTVLTPTSVTSSRLAFGYDAIGPHR